jgi:hypothetical protein
MRSILLACFLLGVTCLTRYGAVAAVTENSALTLNLVRTPDDAVTGGPVFVGLEISNMTPETLQVNLGAGRKSAISLLISKDGGQSKLFTLPAFTGLARSSWVKIEGKQSYTTTLLINEWLELGEAGTYSLEAVANMQVRPSSDAKPLQAKSNSVAIVLAERDKIRLEAICRRLRDRALTENDIDAKSLAALALSSVIDPVAVPYLQQLLLQGRIGKQHAAQGLWKIGNAAAVTALISGLKGSQADTADLSRDALLRVQDSSASREAKAMASSALNLK